MTKKSWPSSPRKLLEARYQAYVDGDIDFILESTHPEVRKQHDPKAIEDWSKNAKWGGITVEKEKEEEKKAFITFSLEYEEQNKHVHHKETAEFRKEDDKWFYWDSTFPKPETVRREGEKVGRNDPCPCGSGKKYKKCCAA
ncbi:MAG: YchJ family metal-binding protein [bacterium]